MWGAGDPEELQIRGDISVVSEKGSWCERRTLPGGKGVAGRESNVGKGHAWSEGTEQPDC